MRWVFSLAGSHAACGLQGGNIYKMIPETEYLIKTKVYLIERGLVFALSSSFPSSSLSRSPFPSSLSYSPHFPLLPDFYALTLPEASTTMFLPSKGPERTELPWIETLRPRAKRQCSYFQLVFLSILSWWNKANYQIHSLDFPLLVIIIHPCVFLKWDQIP